MTIYNYYVYMSYLQQVDWLVQEGYELVKYICNIIVIIIAKQY